MKKYLFSVVFTVVLATSAPAAIILSDAFTYPDGDISTAPGSPWMVHSGLTPANIAGNELRLTGGNSADVNALLAGGPYLSNSPAVLYASFKMRVTSQPGNVAACPLLYGTARTSSSRATRRSNETTQKEASS